MKDSPCIMVIDDLPQNLRLLAEMLQGADYRVRPFLGGPQALKSAEEDPPDLVLLDIDMPGMNGFEVCAAMKGSTRLCEVPIVFISALHHTEAKLEAFQHGGVDYITKPFHLAEVEVRVENQLALKRAQSELQRSNQRLRELEQLRDDLTHMVVHDMRSPLAAILTSLPLLEKALTGSADEMARLALDAAASGGQRLLQMVDDLLDVGRLEAGEMPVRRAECDLGRLARDAVAAVAGLASDREVRILAAEDCVLSGDPELVRRVIENLVTNGLKHTSPDGELRVMVGWEGDTASLRVTDRGPGVPAHLRERIFDKFGRLEEADGKTHGTGLGLAFCRLAVEAHGGSIRVEDNPGGGSTFIVDLPRNPVGAPAPEDAAAARSEP